MSDELAERRKGLRARSRLVSGHGLPDATAELRRVAEWCAANDIAQDTYGAGAFIEGFETEVAVRFGLEAGRFMPSGTMAQGIAMRIWCGPGGHFGMHPTCHLEGHEQRGYSHLHGLRATLIGPSHRPMLAADLEAVHEPIAALIVELPTRENGGQLPTWEELTELSELAGNRGIKMHLDGARVWEAQPGYDRPLAEIAALFDSVYVSFYKGIGALPGSMLLGPGAMIDEATIWQRRMGGNLYTLLPNVASAAMRLEAKIERFPAYLDRARRLAAALAEVEGMQVIPDPPHTNLMHVVLDLESEAALTARDRVAEETGVWLFGGVFETDIPGKARFEWYVGEAVMAVPDEEVVAAFRSLPAG